MLKIEIPRFEKINTFNNVPIDFLPWKCDLSPSALYNCALKCRKIAKIKTPEARWMSIRRWITSTPTGIELPEGVFYSVKRKEEYSALPSPRLNKTEYILWMFPYGNVWSQKENCDPMSEEWMFSDDDDGMLVIEHMILEDANIPVPGYFESVYSLFSDEKRKLDSGEPHMIGIHMKRKRKENG